MVSFTPSPSMKLACTLSGTPTFRPVAQEVAGVKVALVAPTIVTQAPFAGSAYCHWKLSSFSGMSMRSKPAVAASSTPLTSDAFEVVDGAAELDRRRR